MYIIDCLYGRIDFKKKVYRCMLSPEMQRLREVRLGNINSLCLTGSANSNRYEHSIGTAYLAKVNIEANKTSFPREYEEAFVLAALFHDLGNGPFGHSYEYIVQKQGFDPEKSIADVILGTKTGPYGKIGTCEPFYLGLQNEISSILNKNDIYTIDKIVRGENPYCSKILSSSIDIDNIDNVYRMAFHMGINIDKRAPIELAKGLICIDNTIYFKESAIPYLYDWYETRKKLYLMLLYNPQDFAAKCMLSELMENVLIREKDIIKWQFTDSELMERIRSIEGEYWKEDALIPISLNEGLISKDFEDENSIRDTMNRLGIEISDKAKVAIIKGNNKSIVFSYYNTEYVFCDGSLYKKGRRIITCPQALATRLMSGDLYGCIGIFVSKQIEYYDLFTNVEKKNQLEMECNYYIEKTGVKNLLISFHGIIDKNKTNRQLEIRLESGELFQIGTNTHDLIIGVFVKSLNYGLKHHEIPSSKRDGIVRLIHDFLLNKGIDSREHTMYSEAKCIEN